MRRRRMRRYRPGKENSMMKLATVFGIILCAVVCGYLTARFVLGPVFGYDTEVLKLDLSSKLTARLEEVVEKAADSAKNGENEAQNGGKATRKSKEDKSKDYVLQFGVFSSKSGAKTLLNQLEKDGIDAKIHEDDNNYKVISDTIDTKEEALKQLEKLKDENNIDVFIDAVD